MPEEKKKTKSAPKSAGKKKRDFNLIFARSAQRKAARLARYKDKFPDWKGVPTKKEKD